MAFASVLPARQRSGSIRISLGQFIKFESASGNKRVRVVSEIRNQGEYDEQHDFYLQLRRRIAAGVRTGDFSPEPIRMFADTVETKNKDKRKRYLELADGLKEFWRAKRPELLGSRKRTVWTGNGLHIGSDPEVVLRIGDHRIVTKIYLLKEPIAQSGITASLQVLRETHHLPGHRVAVLDCERGRLILDTRLNSRSSILLNTEAQAFVNIWQALDHADEGRRESGAS